MLFEIQRVLLGGWRIVVACAILCLGILVGLGAARRRTLRRIARSRSIGRDGAERALEILYRAGFRVVATEVTARGVVRVDGREVPYSVRADAIVRRFFRRYVAEFKGGSDSARIENRTTRRQLLEYAVVFECSGILLVDADAGEVHRIDFPALS